MKYLNKFSEETAYEEYRRSFEGLVPHDVALVGSEVKYYSETSPFYFEAVENTTLKFSYYTTVEYSYDALTWKVLSEAIEVPAGTKVYLMPPDYDSESAQQYARLQATGKYKLGGALYSNIGSRRWYGNEFKENSYLVSLEDLILPNTTNINWFNSLFAKCTNLIKGPRVLYGWYTGPDWSYYAMFSGCTELEEGPAVLMNRDAIRDSEINLNSLYKGCDKINKLTLYSRGYNSNLGPSGGSFTAKFTEVVTSESGEALVNTAFADSLPSHAYKSLFEALPSGWSVVVRNLDTGEDFVYFFVKKSDSAASRYVASKNTTWNQWIAETTDTGFSVGGDGYVMCDGECLFLQGVKVLGSDIINCYGNSPYIKESLVVAES